MKLYCSNKFDLCYYGQVNSLRLNSRRVNGVASKWANKPYGGVNYFASDGTCNSYTVGYKSPLTPLLNEILQRNKKNLKYFIVL